MALTPVSGAAWSQTVGAIHWWAWEVAWSLTMRQTGLLVDDDWSINNAWQGGLYKGFATRGLSRNVSHLTAGNDVAAGAELLKMDWGSAWFWNVGGFWFTKILPSYLL